MNQYADPRWALAKALANHVRMDGTTQPVREIVDGADVVFGVWIEAAEPDGIGTYVIKGVPRLEQIVETQVSASLTFDAILCDCYERAVAVQLVFGDGKPSAGILEEDELVADGGHRSAGISDLLRIRG